MRDALQALLDVTWGKLHSVRYSENLELGVTATCTELCGKLDTFLESEVCDLICIYGGSEKLIDYIEKSASP
jgi:hypothetical protein